MTRKNAQIVLVAAALMGVAGAAAGQETEELVPHHPDGTRRTIDAPQRRGRDHRDRGGR